MAVALLIAPPFVGHWIIAAWFMRDIWAKFYPSIWGLSANRFLLLTFDDPTPSLTWVCSQVFLLKRSSAATWSACSPCAWLLSIKSGLSASMIFVAVQPIYASSFNTWWTSCILPVGHDYIHAVKGQPVAAMRWFIYSTKCTPAALKKDNQSTYLRALHLVRALIT